MKDEEGFRRFYPSSLRLHPYSSHQSLHVGHVEPAAELEADLLQLADGLNPAFPVQRDAAVLAGVDEGDDAAVADGGGGGAQVVEQRPADALAVQVVADVD